MRKGILLDSTDCDTTHCSVVEFEDQWYLFYHNSVLSGNGCLRSCCFDKVFFNEDGTIQKVKQTGKLKH
jgi:arabinoxylan arabinofuranohydrolase